MADLPQCRVETTVRPFVRTGVDYFGPYLITERRSRFKMKREKWQLRIGPPKLRVVILDVQSPTEREKTDGGPSLPAPENVGES
jgi:hypothetical protein